MATPPMSTAERRKARKVSAMRSASKAIDNGYTVSAEALSLSDKLAIIEKMERPELIDLFKGWEGRKKSTAKKKTAPLDQRVTVTVTSLERISLDRELQRVRASGEKISMSQFIRNRALGSVDINGWRDLSAKALGELEDTLSNRKAMEKSRTALTALMDEEDDDDEVAELVKQIDAITESLNKTVAQDQKRQYRLSGRMSMHESEVIKWRAQRLCISASDYLRMMIFNLTPDSTADAHMSIDAKRRFYVSIIEVAANGWGEPPTIYNCAQCSNYVDEISRLKEENRQLRAFA